VQNFNQDQLTLEQDLARENQKKRMNRPIRRKIVYHLMLVGNAGIVTVMSSLILTFILPDTLASKVYGFLIVIILVYWAINSK